MNDIRITKALALAAFVFFVAACSGVDKEPILTNIGNAEMAVKQAESGDANQYAPLDLRQAEEKLQKARSAFAKEDYEKANYLAEEALVEANVALAKTETAKTKQLVENLESSIMELRQQIEKSRTSR
jgi:Domain of unknown function (DUF4398)